MNQNRGYCEGCNFVFTESSKKFYCCDPKEKYCIICRVKQCPKCHNTRNNLIKEASCSRCLRVPAMDADLYHHSKCNTYYCNKCLISRIGNKQVVLFCGHSQPLDLVQNFMNRFCMYCGEVFNEYLDYQIVNGKKCCCKCYPYEHANLQPLMFYCMNCGNVIKRKILAGTINSDLVLCKNCTTFSQIQQKSIAKEQQQKIKQTLYSQFDMHKPEKSKQSIESLFKTNDTKTSKQAEKSYEKTQSKNDKKNIKDADIKQIQSVIELQENSNIKESQVPKQQVKKVQTSKNQGSAENNTNKTVLHRFPSNDITQSKSPKMKKHMSMDTYIEGMKIQIPQQKCRAITCEQCEYLIEQKQVFQVPSPQKSKKYCRLCYTLKNKNESLSFNTTNYLSPTLVDSRDKRGTSSRKNNFHTPIKKDKMETFKSGVFQNPASHTVYKPSPYYTQAPKKLNESQCSQCNKANNTLIRRANDGAICFQCYYRPKQVGVQ